MPAVPIRAQKGLTAPQSAALEAIVRAPAAWSSTAGLAWCQNAIEQLWQAGYLERWQPPTADEVLVALTPWAAFVLGVTVDEGPDEQPTYVEAPPDDPRHWPRRPIRLAPREHERPLRRPELVVDPRGLTSLAWDVPPDPQQEMVRLKRFRQSRRAMRQACQAAFRRRLLTRRAAADGPENSGLSGDSCRGSAP